MCLEALLGPVTPTLAQLSRTRLLAEMSPQMPTGISSAHASASGTSGWSARSMACWASGPFQVPTAALARVALLHGPPGWHVCLHPTVQQSAASDDVAPMLRAAPMLITSVQFALQHLLARLAIATPWVAAPEEGLSWEDWWKKGEPVLLSAVALVRCVSPRRQGHACSRECHAVRPNISSLQSRSVGAAPQQGVQSIITTQVQDWF